MLRRLLPLLCAAGAASAAPAQAATGELAPPMRLPGLATAASAGDTWLLGTRDRVIEVPAGRARAVARSLRRRGRLWFAEPNPELGRSSVWEATPGEWARGAVVPPALPWPAPGAEIAVIDDFVDDTLPDLAGQVRFMNGTTDSPIEAPHGTQVASVAAGAADGAGVLGVLPGAPIASFGVSLEATCAEVSRAIDGAVRARIPVVNVSLGTHIACFTLYIAVQRAYRAGTLVVASAGNEFAEGNPVIYPAAFPHVLAVAATTRDGRASGFSSANAAVDIAAPGEDIPTAIPPAFDVADGTPDGFTSSSGTSFAAPIVAAAAAWVRSARPELAAAQVADVLRGSARDLGRQGWDRDTGWGQVDVQAALSQPEPPTDPGEPNDGIPMVDGSVFRHADRLAWRGSGRRTIRAWADQVEDPLDVYRIRLSSGSRARVTLLPAYGDPDLQVFDRRARTTEDRRNRVCVSSAEGRRRDACTLTWSGRGTRVAYVAISVADSDDGLAAGYRLRFQRLRSRR